MEVSENLKLPINIRVPEILDTDKNQSIGSFYREISKYLRILGYWVKWKFVRMRLQISVKLEMCKIE